MKKKTKKLIVLLYALLTMALCGCGQKDYDKHYYVLETERRDPLLKKQTQNSFGENQ